MYPTGPLTPNLLTDGGMLLMAGLAYGSVGGEVSLLSVLCGLRVCLQLYGEVHILSTSQNSGVG